MTTPGTNVAATVDVREAHRFDVGALERYLAERIERIGNINALRRRAPHAWPPSP